MNSTYPTAVLSASLVAATVCAQEREAGPRPESVTETHPMRALARLERGRWRLAGDTPVCDHAVHTSAGSTHLYERRRFVDDATVEQKLWTGAADGLRSLVFEGFGRKRGESP